MGFTKKIFSFVLQANNAVIRVWGEKRSGPKLKNHVELVELLGIADTKKGMQHNISLA